MNINQVPRSITEFTGEINLGSTDRFQTIYYTNDITIDLYDLNIFHIKVLFIKASDQSFQEKNDVCYLAYLNKWL